MAVIIIIIIFIITGSDFFQRVILISGCLLSSEESDDFGVFKEEEEKCEGGRREGGSGDGGKKDGGKKGGVENNGLKGTSRKRDKSNSLQDNSNSRGNFEANGSVFKAGDSKDGKIFSETGNKYVVLESKINEKKNTENNSTVNQGKIFQKRNKTSKIIRSKHKEKPTFESSSPNPFIFCDATNWRRSSCVAWRIAQMVGCDGGERGQVGVHKRMGKRRIKSSFLGREQSRSYGQRVLEKTQKSRRSLKDMNERKSSAIKKINLTSAKNSSNILSCHEDCTKRNDFIKLNNSFQQNNSIFSFSYIAQQDQADAMTSRSKKLINCMKKVDHVNLLKATDWLFKRYKLWREYRGKKKKMEAKTKCNEDRCRSKSCDNFYAEWCSLDGTSKPSIGGLLRETINPTSLFAPTLYDVDDDYDDEKNCNKNNNDDNDGHFCNSKRINKARYLEGKKCIKQKYKDQNKARAFKLLRKKVLPRLKVGASKKEPQKTYLYLNDGGQIGSFKRVLEEFADGWKIRGYYGGVGERHLALYNNNNNKNNKNGNSDNKKYNDNSINKYNRRNIYSKNSKKKKMPPKSNNKNEPIDLTGRSWFSMVPLMGVVGEEGWMDGWMRGEELIDGRMIEDEMEELTDERLMEVNDFEIN